MEKILTLSKNWPLPNKTCRFSNSAALLSSKSSYDVASCDTRSSKLLTRSTTISISLVLGAVTSPSSGNWGILMPNLSISLSKYPTTVSILDYKTIVIPQLGILNCRSTPSNTLISLTNDL
jgi:hypothetical protein